MAKRIPPRWLLRSIRGLPFLLLLLLAVRPAAGSEAGTSGGAPAGRTDGDVPEAAGRQSDGGRRAQQRVGWSGFAQGGYVHRFDSSGDSGGSFEVNRFFVESGAAYAPDLLRSFSLALGYGLDAYRWPGGAGFTAPLPWERVHTFRISTPVRWAFDRGWTLFVIPTVRATAEEGAAVEESMQGGGFVGCSYRFGERLTIGPGVGVITEIEDDPTVFPVLLVDWGITDRLRLGTGRGLGATVGPGLALSFEATEEWSFQLGGRYEKLRFRLNAEGASPNGVGEDRFFPVYAGVTYSFFPIGRVSLLGGVDLGEEHRLEDERGNRIAREYYDPAGSVGLSFNARF